MKNDVINALSGIVPDERIDIITETLDQLAALNFDAHLDELIQILATNYEVGDSATLVDSIEGVLRRAIDILASSCGVQVLEGDFLDYAPVLETLLDWDRYLFPRVIRDLLEVGADAKEKFALVVEEITLTPSDDVLEIIDEVSDAAIDRMIERLDEVLLEEPTVEEPDRALRSELRHYIQALSYDPLILSLAQQGYQFHTQFDVLIAVVLDALDRLPLARRGEELYLIKLYSGNEQSIVDLLHDYTDSTQDRLVMNAAIAKMVSLYA